MHVHDVGRGAPVVLLHGTPNSIDYFGPLVEALAGDRRVLVPECPGYGQSPALPRPWSMDDVQRALEDALLERGVKSCDVLGFSGGGYRALRLALTSARIEVTRVVTHGGMATFTPEHRAGLAGVAEQIRALAGQPNPALRRDIAALMVSASYFAAHPEVVDVVSRWIDACAPADLADDLLAFVGSEDLTPLLAKLRAPLTARVGTLDAATPPAYSEQLAALVPGAKLERVEGVDHALLLEDRAATIASVRAALGAPLRR